MRGLGIHSALREQWLPLLLAVLLWIEVLGSWVPAEQGARGVALLLGTSMCVVLALRRRVAFATAAVVGGLLAAWVFAGPPAGSLAPWLVCLVAVYAAAQEQEWVRAIGGAGVVLASNWLQTLVVTNDFVDYVFVTVFAAGAWAAGRAVRARQLKARQATAEAARLAQESDRLAVAAVAAERRRIARELHDVVAHSMGVIVVQAQAAAGLLGREAIDARLALESIERTGQEALVEMRRMLGLMREADGGDSADPLPSLRQVERLVAEVRAAGVLVALDIHGLPRTLPAAVDASAYRIMQESLTNVVKHAGAARAEVTITYLPDSIELSVHDTGRNAQSSGHTGHGLVGIRERVAVFAGTVDMGPSPRRRLARPSAPAGLGAASHEG